MASPLEISMLFNQYLGKLFYAIAMADSNVMDKEYFRLKDMIKQKWNDINNINIHEVEQDFRACLKRI